MYSSCLQHLCVTWLIHMCDMTYSCVWRYAFVCWTWLVCMCDMTHSPDPCVLVESWAPICDMTHSYVWRDSIVSVTWLVRTCDMTHSYMSHDSFVCVTWLIRMNDMTHSYKWHDSFVCVTRLILGLCALVASLASFGTNRPKLSHVTRANASCDMTHSRFVCARRGSGIFLHASTS